MTTQISHKFTSAKVDGPDATLVRPSNWNATHNPYLSMTNRSGSAVGQFDCCAVGTANDDSFTKTTTVGDTRPLVVVQDAAGIADATPGNVQSLFETTVNVQGNVTRGNWVRFSATAGRLEDTGVAGTSPAPGGAVAIAVTGYAGGAAGTVTALLRGATSTGGGPVAVQVFTVNGNYTPTAGATIAVVEVVGGGGGGGGTNVASGSGGGGGGGYARKRTTATAQVITIGAAGAAGASPGDGGTGGTTSFGAVVTATGGSGGGSGAGTTAGGNGGLGATGDVNVKGGGGSGGITAAANGHGGAGGNSVLGGGGAGISGGSNAGGAFGGGGSGAGSGGTVGAAGGAGVCIVTEY